MWGHGGAGRSPVMRRYTFAEADELMPLLGFDVIRRTSVHFPLNARRQGAPALPTTAR